MMDLRRLMFFDHPNLCFVTLAGMSTFCASTQAPAFIPVALALSTLLVYSRILFPGRHALRNTTTLWLVLALAGSLPKLVASLNALSTPTVSLLVLFAMSCTTSFFTLAALYIDTRVCTRLPSAWSQVTLFPAIWATVWWGVSYASPVGRLSTWSPLEGVGAYGWMLHWLGPAGNDWVVAAWAVVVFQAIGVWFIGPEDTEGEGLLIPHSASEEQPKLSTRTESIWLLGIFLVTLTGPSFALNSLPLPVLSPDTTPLSVGCVLPPFHRYKHHRLTLDDYINESQKLTSSAKILLWPEGAVSFDSESERDLGLEKVRKAITGSHVGVSFEEFYSDPRDETGRTSLRRTGLAVISKSSQSPHLIYYKRHLVPIAESFSLSHSVDPPTIYTLNLAHPSGMNKTDWAPGPKYTRPIPLTSSICLDFATPLPFADLESRPALILAPARTWQVSVGYAMWQQAKQRAEEMGSMVLWCDGGEGGVSGIGGGGYSEVFQVGHGSWVKTIASPYPFNQRRTTYVRFGNLSLLVFWTLVLGTSIGPSFTGRLDLGPVRRGAQVKALFNRLRRGGRASHEREGEREYPVPNLLD